MGRAKSSRQCPHCGSKNVVKQDLYGGGIELYFCNDCDYEFETGYAKGGNHDEDYDGDSYSDNSNTEEEEWES